MSEVWSKWQGHVVNDTFPLRRYLGSSDHSGVFLTDLAGREPTEVAIKLVRVMPHLVESYRQQWELAATVEHPQLIRLLETGRCQLEGQPYLYLVMEYAEQTLAQLLERRALTEDEASELLLPVLDTLAFLHNRNLVQGQLKPANILVVGDELRLASDTIRNVSDATASINMVSVYDPPEIHDGTVSAAGDLWALGITLFEALTRSPPIGLDVRRESVTLPDQFSPMFRDIVGGCLSRRTFDRPKASELAARLRGQAEGGGARVAGGDGGAGSTAAVDDDAAASAPAATSGAGTADRTASVTLSAPTSTFAAQGAASEAPDVGAASRVASAAAASVSTATAAAARVAGAVPSAASSGNRVASGDGEVAGPASAARSALTSGQTPRAAGGVGSMGTAPASAAESAGTHRAVVTPTASMGAQRGSAPALESMGAHRGSVPAPDSTGTHRALAPTPDSTGPHRVVTATPESTGTHRAVSTPPGSTGVHRAATAPTASTGPNRALATPGSASTHRPAPASPGSAGTHRALTSAPGSTGTHRTLAPTPESTGTHRALSEGQRQETSPPAPGAANLAAAARTASGAPTGATAAARTASGTPTGAAARVPPSASPGANAANRPAGVPASTLTAAGATAAAAAAAARTASMSRSDAGVAHRAAPTPGPTATPDPAKAQRPAPKPIVIEHFTPESLMPELAAQRSATNSGQSTAPVARHSTPNAPSSPNTAAAPPNGTPSYHPSSNTAASHTTLTEVAATMAALNTTESDPAADDPDQQPSMPRSLLPVALGAVVLLALGVTAVFILRSRNNTPPPVVESYQDGPVATASDSLPATASDEPAALPVAASSTATRPRQNVPRSTPAAVPVPTAASAAPTLEIHEEIPEVPPRVLQTIRGHVRVSVRLIVDKEGAVFAALVDEPGPSRYFEHLAIEAAKKWTFPPLDTTGSRLELVRFEFTRQGATGRAIEIE